MIDTVHVRVPALSPYAADMAKSLGQLHKGPCGPFRPSRFYEAVGSLREHFGIEAILHFGCKHGARAHKIEIIDAGKKSLKEMADLVGQLF